MKRANVPLKMSLSLLFFVLTACGVSDGTTSDLKIYGADSLPVTLEFSTYFYIPAKDFEKAPEVEQLSLLSLSAEQQKLVAKRIHAHAMFVHGVFNIHTEPFDFFTNSGSIKDPFQTQVRGIEYDERAHTYMVTYDFSAEGSFSRDVLGKAKTKNIQFYMPNDPVNFYQAIMDQTDVRDKDGQKINPCTSDYDNSDLAFYYYWFYDWNKACPRAFFKSQIHTIEATFHRLKETKKTYPEYDRLYEGKNAKHPLRIEIIHGYDEVPPQENDVGQLSFDWDARRFDELGWAPVKVKSGLEQRRWKFATSRYHAQVRMAIMDSDTKEFDEYVKEALRKADIFIYSGHSRDGYYFDIKRLYGSAKALSRTKKYQIIFDNSCNSFTYFHRSFFQAKQSSSDPAGTANLDVLTNVISAPFFVEPSGYSQNYLLLTGLLGLDAEGKSLSSWLSWQQLLSKMFDHVEYVDTSMTVVLGDEDNPTSAKKFGRLPVPSNE